jgi:hypothetical protein
LCVNADKTSTVLFTHNRKLMGFKNRIRFGTELQLKNQAKYLGFILDEKLNWSSHIDHRMQKGDRENMGIETKGCVLDIHFGGETDFDLRCLTVVENASQISVNQKKAHLQRLAFYSNCSSGSHTDVATSWYLYLGRGKTGDLQTELFFP